MDWKKYDVTGKEIHYVQIGYPIEKVTTDQSKTTDEMIKRAEFDFMLDLKSIIEKTATDPELVKVRVCIRKRERDQMPPEFRHGYEKISDRWGVLFNDDRIIIPAELRPKLLDTLHHGHAGTTKMLADAKIFW